MLPTFIIIVIGIIAIVIFVSTRRPNLNAEASRSTQIHTALTPTEAIDRIVENAPAAGLNVAARDNAGDRLVLSEGISGFSWGMFFPVHVRAGDERTTVTIGVRAKFPQISMIPTARLEKAQAKIANILSDKS
jgi:hypothetical protein